MSLILSLVLAVAPANLVSENPGPVFTLFDGDSDSGLIEVPPELRKPTTGRMDGLAVYLRGSRETPLMNVVALAQRLDPQNRLVPMSFIYPDTITTGEAIIRQRHLMEDSQKTAVALALQKLGYKTPSQLVVYAVLPTGASAGILEADDILLKLNGAPLASYAELLSLLQTAVSPEVTVTVERRGEQREFKLNLKPSPTGTGFRMGLGIRNNYDLPVAVTFRQQNVGGPSAGLMFSLAIYALLSGENLTGGTTVVGTGSLLDDGRVVEVGGVQSKMYAALDQGAKTMLVPLKNCADLAGLVPEQLRVYGVSSFDQALSTLRALSSGDSTSSRMASRCK